MELWGITDSGKVRRQNQDVFKVLFDEEREIAVLVVCDGMGGAKAGNVASDLAADSFVHYMGKYIEDIGDSRLYHVTYSSITQITKDHSVVQEMIERGDLTRTEARIHPRKNLITRALGTSDHEPPDVFHLKLASGDHILLCSDGLSNVILDSELLFEIQRGNTVREICESLVEIALERGAPDNVTTVLFKK